MRVRSGSSTKAADSGRRRPGYSGGDGWRRRAVFLVACYAAAMLVAVVFAGTFSGLDDGVYDTFLVAKNGILKPHPNRRVVNLDLDDATLNAPDAPTNIRRYFALLLDTLSGLGAEVVVSDFVFKDVSDQATDAVLESAIARAGKVYLPYVYDPGAVNESAGGGDLTAVLGTNALFARSAAGFGNIWTPPDADGVFRRYSLVVKSRNGFIPSMALSAVLAYYRAGTKDVEIAWGSRVTVRLPEGSARKELVVPIDAEGMALIPFAGTWNSSLYHISAREVAKAAAEPDGAANVLDLIEGRIVLIGDTSSAGKDNGTIPGETDFPRVGLHSSMISALLAGTVIRFPNLFLSAAVLVLAFAAQWLIFKIGKTSYQALALGALLILVAAASFAAFFWFSATLRWAEILFCVLVASIQAVIRKSHVEERERMRTTTILGRYFSPSVVDDMLAEGGEAMAPRQREVTILFTDIKGFTLWSSKREAPEVHGLLKAYAETLSGIVFEYDGTVDKFIGDGMLAFFNAPVEFAGHAERAVLAALEMQRAFRDDDSSGAAESAQAARGRIAAAGGRDLALRIGIHTGEAVVGNLGSDEYMNYTVIGSEVNLAQRLESNAVPGKVLISEAVYRGLSPAFLATVATERREITAKGFEDSVFAYDLEEKAPGVGGTGVAENKS